MPPWRFSDVRREVDLIEEVARIHGLDKLPTTLPARGEAIGRLTVSQPLRRRLEDLLRDRGLLETISYSFTSPEKLARLRVTDVEPLRIENPLSEDHSVMRPLLLPGLLDAAQHNAAHGRPGIRAVRVRSRLSAGRSARAGAGRLPRRVSPSDERHHIAALLTEAAPAGWRTPAREADFFAAKALAGGTDGGGRLEAEVEVQAPDGGRPFLHPGRSAAVVAARGAELGWIGEVHPLVAARVGARGAGGGLRARRRPARTSSPAGASPPTATSRASPPCCRTSP